MRKNMGLYRGKRKDNGEWVEGNLFENDNGNYPMVLIGHVIMSRDKHTNELSFDGFGLCEVDPETVGQFTGLTDKNGKKIFEGDIVKQTFEKTVAIAIADLWGVDEYADLYGEDVGAVVILPSKGTCIKNPVIHREANGEITQDGEVAKMYKNICSGRCEVIGNIHDNQELLEVSK